MILIMIDFVAIPLQVFGVSHYAVTEWVLRIYWTLDIIVAFRTGFDRNGRFVGSPMTIAYQYASGWCFLDLFLVLVDWIVAFETKEIAEVVVDDQDQQKNLGEVFGLARFGKTFRVARLFRLLRLFRILRLMKLPALMAMIEERVNNEPIMICLGIVKLTIGILLLNHLIACIWFALGVSSASGWVKKCRMNDKDWGFQYSTSLHWSLTQFTPASMEIVPQTPTERGYNIVVIIIALVIFSSFVSSITNAMTSLRNINSEYTKQLLVFQRYLRFRKVPIELSVRMRRHVEHELMATQRRLEEKDVVILKWLSEPLLMDLHLEVYRGDLQLHPFFKTYIDLNFNAARKICHVGITETTLSMGDVVFINGESCNRMFFVKSGELIYQQQDDIATGDIMKTVDVEKSDWISESCLWTPWSHVGQLMASSKVLILRIDAAQVREVAVLNRVPLVQVSKYAMHYILYLNHVEHLSDLDDGFDYEEAWSLCHGHESMHFSTPISMFVDSDGDASDSNLTAKKLLSEVNIETTNSERIVLV